MSSGPFRAFLKKRQALYLAGALSLAAIVQYSNAPRVKYISEGGQSMVVNQGTDALVISEPFSGTDLIDLYRNKEAELLEIRFSHARFSDRTLEGLRRLTTSASTPPPAGYGDIGYRLPPQSSQRSECKASILISPANATEPIDNLFFSLTDTTIEKRVLNLRADGGRMLATVQYGRGCSWYWLNAGEWQRERRAPIGDRILVNDGANIEFTLIRPAAGAEQVSAQTSESDWSVDLLPGRQKFRKIEVRAVRQGITGERPGALRIGAITDEDYLRFRGMKVGLKEFNFEIYEDQPAPGSKAILQGPRIGNEGSRWNYLKVHTLQAALFFVFLVVPLLLIIGVAWPRIVGLWAFCALITHKIAARLFLRGPYALQYWTERRNYFLEKQALVPPGAQDFVFKKEVEMADAAIEKIRKDGAHTGFEE